MKSLYIAAMASIIFSGVANAGWETEVFEDPMTDEKAVLCPWTTLTGETRPLR